MPLCQCNQSHRDSARANVPVPLRPCHCAQAILPVLSRQCNRAIVPIVPIELCLGQRARAIVLVPAIKPLCPLCPKNCAWANVPLQLFLCLQLSHLARAIVCVPESSCLCHHACANVPVPKPSSRAIVPVHPACANVPVSNTPTA